MSGTTPAWLDEVKWNAEGLVAAVAQDMSGRVLTVAWMNREALLRTAREGRAIYWSRSRGKLWVKGEESGFAQQVEELRLDCDGDAVLLRVTQQGGIACHTGRAGCFFRKLGPDGWEETDPVLKDPGEIYGKGKQGKGPK